MADPSPYNTLLVLPNLQFYCNNPNDVVSSMPGRSSTVPGDTSKMESSVPLLGEARQVGSMDQHDGVKDERHSTMYSTPLTAEVACRWEQYCILVQMETAKVKKPLQAHTWGEALLKDFFQDTIGVPYVIIIISPIECMLFTPG